MTARAEAELVSAMPGTALAAGRDFMVKTGAGTWFRPADGSMHSSEGVADFHGHSGYSLIDPQPTTRCDVCGRDMPDVRKHGDFWQCAECRTQSKDGES
jgi:hypothetical protein